MRRRTFIAALGAVATWPVAARSQSAKTVRRVGFLSGRARPDTFENDAHGASSASSRERIL